MVYRLNVLMGTRYAIGSLMGRLRMALEKALEDGATVDLADCKMSPEAVDMINRYYDRIKFINSADPKANAILENNNNFRMNPPEVYPSLTYSANKDLDTFLRLARDLPMDGKYLVDIKQDNIMDIATLALLIMARPDLELDLSKCSNILFQFVNANLELPASMKIGKYIENMGSYCIIREKNADGLFGCEDYGFMEEHVFISERSVLPYEFGSRPIINLFEATPTPTEWIKTVENIMLVLSEDAGKSKKVSIEDFLTFRE